MIVREHAEALALAIEHGLADPNEAVKWACELITEQDNPFDALVELAGAARPHPLDVVGMLRRFPGSAEPTRVFRKVLGRFRDLLGARPNALPEITHALEQMALRGDVPELLAGPCYGFDDQRLLAERGVYGNVQQVHQELMAFLETEADPSPSGEARSP